MMSLLHLPYLVWLMTNVLQRYILLFVFFFTCSLLSMLGNYDVIQQPRNISSEAKRNIPFYMFVDEETEKYMKNASILSSSRRVGLWRIIVVHNIPYADSRRNGKVDSLLFASHYLL